MSFAGDISPTTAFEMLSTDASAVLVDVRTEAELVFVGYADLNGIGKRMIAVEWQQPPSDDNVSAFVAGLSEAGIESTTPVLFICRSGVRSRFAAQAAAARGFETTYNVADGFEGNLDASQHRGSTDGWKVVGLPWRQS